jgi:hypothetical protein
MIVGVLQMVVAVTTRTQLALMLPPAYLDRPCRTDIPLTICNIRDDIDTAIVYFFRFRHCASSPQTRATPRQSHHAVTVDAAVPVGATPLATRDRVAETSHDSVRVAGYLYPCSYYATKIATNTGQGCL